MGICRYCGQKAGWFSDAHDTCIERANQRVQELQTCIATALKGGKQYGDIKSQVDKIITDSSIPAEQVTSAFKTGWSAGAEERAKAQPISDQEFSAISDVYRAAGLTQDDIRKSAGFRALTFSFLIWTVLYDQIEPYVGPIRFNVQSGEVPVFGIANVLVSEEQTVSAYAGGYSGASLRVASGFYYHLGGVRGHRVESTSLQSVDYGDFLMTTHSVYFGGREKGVNFRVPYTRIVRFNPYSDAVGICKDHGREQIFAPQQVPDTGWFLFNILQALASRQSAKASHAR